MKLLRSITTGPLATSKWALLGGAALWLSVALATPAQATNYVIDPGGSFSGSFQLDLTNLTTPFTTWAITVVASPFFNDTLAPGSLPNEDQFNSDQLYMSLEQYTNDSNPYFGMVVYLPQFGLGPRVDLFFSKDFQIGNTLISASATQSGTYSQVPEPTALLLLAIGLLALAGSRWLPRRGARQ